jgi:adenylate kinase family enzyme
MFKICRGIFRFAQDDDRFCILLSLTIEPYSALIAELLNSFTINMNQLPQIIILYGPPNAGKGTQSEFLKKTFPDRYHLDFGSELRAFVTRHVGDMKQAEEMVNLNSKSQDVEVARRVKSDMMQSNPVKSEDLKYIIESAIVDCVTRGQDMIIEGPGRLVAEAEWLSGFLNQEKVKVCIFHLHVALEEVLERASKRYYVPGLTKPFISFEEAKNSCAQGQEPYRRAEDMDIEGTKKRYWEMYAKNFALITSIYQLVAKSDVFTLDGRKPIAEVSQDILAYFDRFYEVKIN